MPIEQFKNAKDVQNIKDIPRDSTEHGYNLLDSPEKRFYLFESQKIIDETKFYYSENALIIRRIQPSHFNNTILKDADNNNAPYILGKYEKVKQTDQVSEFDEKGSKQADRIITEFTILSQQYVDLNITDKVLWLCEKPQIDNKNVFYRITDIVVEQEPLSLDDAAQAEDVADNQAQITITALNTNFFNKQLQNYSEYFTTDSNPLDKNDLAMGFERRALLGINGIQVEGQMNENNKLIDNFPVDVKLNGQFVPWKVSINEIKNNKILYHMDWFDNNVVLSYWIAHDWPADGTSLENLRINKFKIQDKDIKIISDMILLTYGFLNNFNFATRYVAADAEVQKNPSLLGKIKETYVCGYGDYKIFDAQNKEPSQYIQNVFDEYVLNNPAVQYSHTRFGFLKALIVALNNFISTKTLSFGRTNNRFNEIYLPWFLSLKDGEQIKVLKASQNVIGLDGTPANRDILDNKIKFVVKSMYWNKNFGIVNNVFPDKIAYGNSIIFSNKKILNSDRSVSLPEVNEELKIKDKYSNVGDIITTTSEDLNYIFYAISNPLFKLTSDVNKNNTRLPDAVTQNIDLTTYGLKNPTPYGKEFWKYNQYVNFDDFILKNNFGIKCDGTNDNACDFKITKVPAKTNTTTPNKVNEKGYNATSTNADYSSKFVKEVKIVSIVLERPGKVIVQPYKKKVEWTVEFKRKSEIIKDLGYDENQANITASTFNWDGSSGSNTIPFGFTITNTEWYDKDTSDADIRKDLYEKYWNVQTYSNWPYISIDLKNNLSNSIYSGEITLELTQEQYSELQIETYKIQPFAVNLEQNTLFDFEDWNKWQTLYLDADNKNVPTNLPYHIQTYRLNLLNASNLVEINYINIKQIFAKQTFIYSKGITYAIDLNNQREDITSFEIFVV